MPVFKALCMFLVVCDMQGVQIATCENTRITSVVSLSGSVTRSQRRRLFFDFQLACLATKQQHVHHFEFVSNIYVTGSSQEAAYKSRLHFIPVFLNGFSKYGHRGAKNDMKCMLSNRTFLRYSPSKLHTLPYKVICIKRSHNSQTVIDFHIKFLVFM